MTISKSQLKRLIYEASDEGDRLVADGKVIWPGLGNRSGLYDYARTVIREKWEKSSKGLLKKLFALEDGAIVEIQTFKNVTRDRGNWVRTGSVIIRSVSADETALPGEEKPKFSCGCTSTVNNRGNCDKCGEYVWED